MLPLTSPPYPLSPTHENNVHQPEIGPGSHRWQRYILPLDHCCFWKTFGLDSYRLQIPLVLLFRLRCMTQPSQANPHRSFWHRFSRLSGTPTVLDEATLSGQASLTRALKTSCHLELKVHWLGISPHHSLQVDTCGIRTHAGPKCLLQNLQVSWLRVQARM